MLNDDKDTLYITSKEQYKKEADIANRIKTLLYEQHRKLITDKEMSFLIIHINRMIRG